MNTKGKLIQLINFNGINFNSFEEAKENFVKEVTKSNEENSECFKEIVDRILTDRVFTASLKFRKFLESYSKEMSELMDPKNSMDMYHKNGMESPLDRLRSRINLDSLKPILHQSTYRSYVGGSCDLTMDVYKNICDRLGIDFTYIMTGNLPDKKPKDIKNSEVPNPTKEGKRYIYHS